ncbi:Long-chain-fatty-acid--AMP ligase FadD29 [Rubripirellula tenax]|uniref:Long-chain-fatty-acid--AMP ligase FadD29 n=1 Tax=Rubripirellula tenax TaxID=2528015 RepID=A0A5C6ERE9_9BACT|nr:AMP-binding protein [Rubripirellula tenax]TWU50974.1 Long-chain-fatty-acid--AMP ligase FadD29 [Rubripirellula tenax]
MNLLETIWTSFATDLDRPRLTFLSDNKESTSLTGREIIQAVDSQAAALRLLADPGDRVLLAYPAGLDFAISFLACLRSGLLPVPVSSPKPRRPLSRYATVARDCDARLAITSDRILQRSDVNVSPNIRWTSPDEFGGKRRDDLVRDVSCDGLNDTMGFDRKPDDLLFLQYTSGSTSSPKGVMVSDRNVMTNLASIEAGFQIQEIEPSRRVVCSWLPTHHDMGLVGVLLSSLVHEGQAVLMSPTSFVASPIRWLQAMSDYAATITVAPTFGYHWATSKIARHQLEGIDLSSLQVAACGAEPVQGSVLDQFAKKFAPTRFKAETFYPCYGLAESTLMVTGTDRQASIARGGPSRLNISRRRLREGVAIVVDGHQEGHQEGHQDDRDDDVDTIVSSGVVHGEGRVAICGIATETTLPDDLVGEIRVQSPSVVMGYWNNPSATKESFRSDSPLSDFSGRWLRTGDLGFVHRDELYVTGRIKDVIIIGGQNHYPHDIELAADEAIKGVAADLLVGGLAAFSIPPGDQDLAPGGLLLAMERVVLCCEMPRTFNPAIASDVIEAVRLAVAKTCDLTVDEILLVRPASLSRTSSGKIQRQLNAQRFRNHDFSTIAHFRGIDELDGKVFPDLRRWSSRPGGRQIVRQKIENAILAYIAQESGDETTFVSSETPFADMGVDSMLAVQLSSQLQRWLGVPLSAVVAWSHPTPKTLSQYLADQVFGIEPTERFGSSILENLPMNEEELIAMIEQMNDEDAAELLAQLEGNSAT